MNANKQRSIRVLREDARLTQKQLAERAGIHPVTISHYETGDMKPSLSNLAKIASVFGVSLDDIAIPNAVA